MFNAQGLFADAGEGEKLEDCGGVGDAQGRLLIGINIFKAIREICHFLFRVFILTWHREDRQMEENSLHNQHNIVNFLLEVSAS